MTNYKTILSFFRKPIGVGVLVFVIAVILSLVFTVRKTGVVDRADSPTMAGYVGSIKCQSCHEKEFALYKTSDHYHAMDSALPRSVRGDFNNSFFVYYGDTSFFYRRDGNYFVRTKDSTGVKKEFLVSFTFGWKPLQQYLVKFSDGRIQSLPFCWDTRPKEKGGQRWFHVYDKEKILPGDELFWTDINQNWNYMCADCHTTNYRKNFDAFANTFHSTWNESNVSCESCHGPASEHMEWTKKKSKSEPWKGFSISLASKALQWSSNNGKGTLLPSEIILNDTLIETCARCHARASRFTDDYVHGQSFLQSHLPATIGSNYYIDGQIKDEDYEYGSFLQSKMYSRGVTCINCHDAHSMQVKVQGNLLCASCHSPEKFDNPSHTFHKVNSTGSQCVSCHMPVTSYMVVDNRLDHSIRIPRPDLSLSLNTPNACNKCHADKSVQWAAGNFLKWYKDKLPPGKTYGELMHAVSRFSDVSEASLNELLSSKTYPAIIKASALEEYTLFATQRTASQVQAYLQSPDAMLRLSALKALTNFPPETVLSFADRLLDDPVAAVRFEAMLRLAASTQQLSPERKVVFDKVFNEYNGIQQGLTNRPEGYLNQGIVLGMTGKWSEAEAIYLQGLKRFPKFVLLYINLADVYRSQNQEAKAKEYIDKGLVLQPENADLHYALGLWYVRKNDHSSGIKELKRAFTIDPKNTSAVYGYAVALFSTGQPSSSIEILESFLKKNGNNAMILDALISICQDQKLLDKSNKYALLRKNVFGY
jgi:tetratricopeptide (TPR) repeat protein/ssDNA-binding Zn-finger/Zn-ribbon topoisomerase 1